MQHCDNNNMFITEVPPDNSISCLGRLGAKSFVDTEAKSVVLNICYKSKKPITMECLCLELRSVFLVMCN